MLQNPNGLKYQNGLKYPNGLNFPQYGVSMVSLLGIVILVWGAVYASYFGTWTLRQNVQIPFSVKDWVPK